MSAAPKRRPPREASALLDMGVERDALELPDPLTADRVEAFLEGMRELYADDRRLAALGELTETIDRAGPLLARKAQAVRWTPEPSAALLAHAAAWWTATDAVGRLTATGAVPAVKGHAAYMLALIARGAARPLGLALVATWARLTGPVVLAEVRDRLLRRPGGQAWVQEVTRRRVAARGGRT